MVCGHTKGDWIADAGYWLCAECFAKINSRPAKYGPFIDSARGTNGPRQVIIFQAAIASDGNGNTLNSFLRAMVKRFQFKTRPKMTDAEAYDYAIEFLRNLGDPFGDPAYDWSPAGAREMADEEMTYWDECDGGN